MEGNRDYYAEAILIIYNSTIMEPQREHLRAIYDKLEQERIDPGFDAAYQKWVDDRAHERGERGAQHGE